MKNGKYETFEDVQEYLDDLYSILSDYGAEELGHAFLRRYLEDLQALYDLFIAIEPLIDPRHVRFIRKYRSELAIKIGYYKKIYTKGAY